MLIENMELEVKDSINQIEEEEEVEEEISEKKSKCKWKPTKKFYILSTIFIIVIISIISICIYRYSVDLEKVDKFFTSPEYESLINFHLGLMQKIDVVSDDYLFSKETNSRFRRLYTEELERIDFLSNNLPKFKANSERIKEIIENGFIEQITNALNITIGPFNFNIVEKIKGYIIGKLKSLSGIKDLINLLDSADKGLNIIKSTFNDVVPKDSIIRSFANNAFVQYVSFGLSFVNLGFTISDTVTKIDVLREIIKKDYKNQFYKIEEDFKSHINEIKNIRKITKDSTREEIVAATKEFKLIFNKIEGDKRKIISLINDIENQIKKTEKKKKNSVRNAFFSALGAVSGIVGAALTLNPFIAVLGVTSAVVNGANVGVEISNVKDYNEALNYLKQALNCTNELKDKISETLSLVSNIIIEFEMKTKIDTFSCIMGTMVLFIVVIMGYLFKK